MKKTSTLIILVALMITVSAPITSFAQNMDTVVVSAYPPGNLNTVINSDTTAEGFLDPNTVYKIQQTGAVDTLYWLTAPISAKGDIRIVGEINPVTGKPPVVAPSILSIRLIAFVIPVIQMIANPKITSPLTDFAIFKLKMAIAKITAAADCANNLGLYGRPCLSSINPTTNIRKASETIDTVFTPKPPNRKAVVDTPKRIGNPPSNAVSFW